MAWPNVINKMFKIPLDKLVRC